MYVKDYVVSIVKYIYQMTEIFNSTGLSNIWELSFSIRTSVEKCALKNVLLDILIYILVSLAHWYEQCIFSSKIF